MSVARFSGAAARRDLDPADYRFRQLATSLSTPQAWELAAAHALHEDGWTHRDLWLLFPNVPLDWVPTAGEPNRHANPLLEKYGKQPDKLERLAMVQLRLVHKWTFEAIGTAFGRNRGRVLRLVSGSLKKLQERAHERCLFN